MLNRLFGNYLVRKQVITSETLNRLLPISKDGRASLATIAIVNRALPPKQALSILEQAKGLGKAFEEVTVFENHLTQDVLEHLGAFQSNDFMVFIQGLWDLGAVNIEDIPTYLDDFGVEEKLTKPQLDTLILDDLDQIVSIYVPIKNKELKEYTLTLLSAIRRLVDPDVYFEKAYSSHSLNLDKYAAQLIAGDIRMKVYIDGEADELLGISSYFQTCGSKTVDEDALDNVAEFINCVNGLYATNLSYDDVSIDMESPEYSLEGAFISGTIYVIPINVNGRHIRAIYEIVQ